LAITQDWHELRDPTGMSLDLVFVIGPIPEPFAIIYFIFISIFFFRKIK